MTDLGTDHLDLATAIVDGRRMLPAATRES
jgi:hypothetical protein